MKKWVRGTNATVLSLAVIGIFIIATVFLGSMKNMQWDLTANKKFTLSEQTIEVIKKLDRDIKVIAFTGGNANPFLSSQVTDLLKEFERRSNRITFVEYDMLKQPSIAQQYNVDSEGTVVFETADQKRNIPFYQMFIPGQQTYMFTGEEKFTQAVMTLTSTEKYPVYFLTGHGEVPMDQLYTLRSNLEGSNYIVKELNLFREGSIPDDAAAIFMMGPTEDISDSETKIIKEYLEGDGRLFLTLGFNIEMATRWKNIDSIMSMLGVENQHSVVIEPKQTILFDPLTIVPNYGFHKIVNKLEENRLVTLLSLAISLNANEEQEAYRSWTLLKSTDRSYGKSNLVQLIEEQDFNQKEQDIQGPLNLAYAIETADRTPKAVIVGGTTFLSDREIMNQGNRDFAMNSVAWLSEQEDQLTIRPREGDQFHQVFIMPNAANRIFYGTIIGFPVFFLVIGGLIWMRRRKG